MTRPWLFFGTVVALLCAHGPAVANGEPGEAVRIEFATPLKDEKAPRVRTVLARLVETGATVDGELDDACWEGATRTTGFVAADGAPSKRPTRVLLCHCRGVIYVAAVCAAAPAGGVQQPGSQEQSSIELLFDSLHDERGCQGIAARADGRWETFSSGTANARLRGISVACRREKNHWILEAALPRKAFTDPENGIWGFNIVRRGPGKAADSWNGLKGNPGRPASFGHIAFETRPCTIKAARLGTLHRGRNTLSVAILNSAVTNAELRAVLAVTPETGKSVETPYKFTAPPKKGQWLAFDFSLNAVGRHDLVFSLFDAQTGAPMSGFTRRALTVPPIVSLTCPTTTDKEGLIRAEMRINLSRDALEKARLQLSLKAGTSRQPTVFLRRRPLPSRRAAIYCDTGRLEPTSYVLRATVISPAGTGSAAATFRKPGRAADRPPPGVTGGSQTRNPAPT